MYDEFPADAPDGMFDQFDRDKDGALNESEVASPPSGGGGAAPGGGQGGAPGGSAPGGAPGDNRPGQPSDIKVQ